MNDTPTYAKAMLSAREKAGLKQKDMAMLAGVHVNTLRRYEKGLLVPTIPVAEALADVLGLTIDEYVGHVRTKRKELPEWTL